MVKRKHINDVYLDCNENFRGYSGACLPKDVRAFFKTGEENNVSLSIINAVNISNKERPRLLVEKISKYFSNNIKNLNFTLLGLSFKPNTDDIRESSSIDIGNRLFEAGANINTYDPKAMENTKMKYDNFKYFSDPYKACDNADAIIICTEWNEFRQLNLKKLIKNKKVIVYDMRNIYSPEKMKKIGVKYYGIGR